MKLLDYVSNIVKFINLPNSKFSFYFTPNISNRPLARRNAHPVLTVYTNVSAHPPIFRSLFLWGTPRFEANPRRRVIKVIIYILVLLCYCRYSGQMEAEHCTDHHLSVSTLSFVFVRTSQRLTKHYQGLHVQGHECQDEMCHGLSKNTTQTCVLRLVTPHVYHYKYSNNTVHHAQHKTHHVRCNVNFNRKAINTISGGNLPFMIDISCVALFLKEVNWQFH